MPGRIILVDVSGVDDVAVKGEVHRLGPERQRGDIDVGTKNERYVGSLGITQCGIKQATRGHGWNFVSPVNDYQMQGIRSGKWPICTTCIPEGELPDDCYS